MAIIDSLIAYYTLEDANDDHGSYNLTNTGSVPFSASLIGNGADFTPNDSLNNNSVLAATSYPRSFQAWFKADTITGSDRAIIALGDGSIHYYILKIRDSDDHIVFRSNNNSFAEDEDTGITASTGTWYHCVFVQHSATTVSIYINGTKTNDTVTNYTATVGQFYLGYLGRSSVWYFDGLIDEVGVWNKALSDAEVTSLYNSGAGLAYPLTEGGGYVFNPQIKPFAGL